MNLWEQFQATYQQHPVLSGLLIFLLLFAIVLALSARKQ